MGDALKKVHPGERLAMPAATFNTFVDAARDFLARQQGQEADPLQNRPRPGVVLVRNDSGEDCDCFAVLGIDGILYTPTDNEEGFKDRPALKGDTPTAPDHRGKFVVALQPIASGKLGRCAATGIVPVQIAVTDEDHRFADISDGSRNTLASAPSGAARILYQESGTGTKWGLVLVGSWGPPLAEDDYAILSWSEADGAYVSGPVRAM
ncbi:MAG: hypothetical protein NTX87_02855 [Planctomycetota bacterium]|nr:hypothetical protein [Planctomycetota bacterium]